MIRRSLSREGFILIRPKKLGDSDRLARAMAMCRGVRKVTLTSGEYGFVVSTKEEGERSLAMIESSIKKVSSNAIAKRVNGHFMYAQRRAFVSK